MQIRPCETDDKTQVVALWNDVFGQPTGHNDPAASFDRKLATDDALLFVAADRAVIIGTVMVGYDGHRGWIYSLAVRTEQRRHGVGTQLMHHAESVLTDLGCPKVNLQVILNNPDAVLFYESLGYQAEPRISLGKQIQQKRTVNERENGPS